MRPFRITGLPREPFAAYFELDDTALAAHNIVRYTVDRTPGFPDRITLRELEPGETALLLNHTHQPAASPYRSNHAIFVGENGERFDAVNVVPEVMRGRLLALRSYDAHGMMHDADVVAGEEVERLIERLFEDPLAEYIHVHNAKRGCYSARIDRA